MFAAAVTAVTLVGNMPSAHAVPSVSLAYGAPELSDDGSTATWTWSLTNGEEPVGHVVVTHSLEPRTLRIVKVSAPCTPTGDTLKCAYGTLMPGEGRTGSIVAEVPADTTGSVKLDGRVAYVAHSAT
ncbi:hypothetical protein ACFYNL_36500 [Streptomyces sp. NPDC007808]|uniref:hypothetical protein n=1 Tax=Streptomyces sp. NPDC007808 TaxID=3364779 RepID=UPI0036AC61F5